MWKLDLGSPFVRFDESSRVGDNEGMKEERESLNSPHFAVAARGKKVALLRAAPDGLRWAESADGLSWEPREPLRAERELRPLCAADAAGDPAFFCADSTGRLYAVEAEGSALALREGVAPADPVSRWYEAAPGASEMSLLRDRKAGVYRLFFCARRSVGRDPERRGCLGVATSADLRQWDVEPPIYAPNQFADLYAPHVLDEPENAVLFYATREGVGRHALRYALAAGPGGPFQRPEPDLLANDARTSVHAARLGERRLMFFGRAGDETGVSRPGELAFHGDGRPYARFYDALLNLMGRNIFHTEATLASSEPLVRVLPRHGAAFRLHARLTARGAQGAGLLFRSSVTGHDNLTLWLDFGSNQVAVRRGVVGRVMASARHTLVPGAEHRVTIWAEGAFADIYVDDEWLLTVPTEGRASGGFGLAVRGGEARFEDVAAERIGE